MASMSKKPLILSSTGLKNIVPNISNTDNDFIFIFGDTEVQMSNINADFVSPLIAQIHRSDLTMDVYKYPPDNDMKAIFSETRREHLKNICIGNKVMINEEEGKNLQVL